jgi:glycolate oxidase
VLALDVVTGDGRLLRTGRTTLKGVTGYDLTSLLVGSEGTLGVVVGATVKLQPLPRSTATATAYFPDARTAVEAVTRLRRNGLRPSTIEFLDHATLVAIDDAQGGDLSTRGKAFLLVQTDGYGADEEMAAVVEVLKATATLVETDADAAERLLATRRQALPSIERLGRVLIEDIVVPTTRLADAVAAIEAIVRDTGVRIFTFAHAGDGNLHPIVLVEEDGPPVGDAVDALFALALELGGTLTGEHGVGLLKRDWLAAELGETGLDLQRRIKAVFDPAGVLNPGKAITER